MNRTLPFAIFFCLSSILAWPTALQAQQDCFNAISVCQDVYSQVNSFSGEGDSTNEINPAISCLGSGELNSAWYIFTVQTTGDICFSITPNLGTEDYDWAVYNLTNANCTDIATDPTLEVSCNYAANSGCGGVTGPNGNTAGPCGAQNEACIPVQAGETYVVNVSNFSASTNGYTLDLSSSSAQIFDTSGPEIDSIAVSCQGEVSVIFSENILCSSIQPTDLTIEDGAGNLYPATSVVGNSCATGGSFENEFAITVGSPFPAGPIYITLTDTVVDNCGNPGFISSADTAFILSTVDLTATQDTICSGDSVILGATSLPQYTYTWTAGNLIDDSTVVVAPPTTMTYTVTATAPNGCTYTPTIEIFVWPVPTADFEVSAPQICADSVLTVSYLGVSGPDATFDWDFDGATVLSGTGSGPYQLSWSTGGPRTLSLTVSDRGCVSDTQQVTVQVPPPTPATIDAPGYVCFGDLATIEAGPSSLSPTANYLWEFDGAIVSSGTGAGPYQVEWLAPGIYDVCLVVEESGCLSPQFCTQVQVGLPPAVGIAPVDDQCLRENEYTFNYTGNSPIATYDWQLGESGQTRTDPAPTYLYQSFGNKEVVLTVTDTFGCVATDTLRFEVFPPVDAAFAFDTVCEGNFTNFTDLSQTQPGHGIGAWDWQMSDGATFVSQNPAHIFPEQGSYIAKLVVTTVDGCRDSLTQSVRVYDQPEAAFAVDTVCAQNAIQFENLSRFDDDDVTYRWQFPNGVTTSNPAPFFTFTRPGSQVVNLTITNADGCTDTQTEVIPVNALPDPAIVADEVCAGTPMQLDGTTAGTGLDSVGSYRWIFPDGSEQRAPTLTYDWESAGRYQLKLITETLAGCRDSVRDSVYVWANPFATFIAEEACLGEPILFASGSGTAFRFGGQLVSHTWTLGDGATLVENDNRAQHTYRVVGLYNVTLEVETDRGCVADTSQIVEVFGIPDQPEMTDDTVCAGDRATLTGAIPRNADDLSWYRDVSVAERFTWGPVFVTPELSQPRTYYVAAVNEAGCESERVPVQASLEPPMVGQLFISDTVLYMPEATAQLQVLGNFVGQSYFWDFGDYTQSEEPSPIHTFQEAGRQLVRVRVVSEAGCELELSRNVTIYQLAYVQVPSAFTPNGDGVNDTYFVDGLNLVGLEFRVFNRWGQVIYETDELGFQWDGTTLRGDLVRTGTYAYRLITQDAHGNTREWSGTITVLR